MFYPFYRFPFYGGYGFRGFGYPWGYGYNRWYW
jgi:hypothetical protein